MMRFDIESGTVTKAPRDTGNTNTDRSYIQTLAFSFILREDEMNKKQFKLETARNYFKHWITKLYHLMKWFVFIWHPAQWMFNQHCVSWWCFNTKTPVPTMQSIYVPVRFKLFMGWKGMYHIHVKWNNLHFITM